MNREDMAIFSRVNPFPNGTTVRHRARVPQWLKRTFGVGQSLQSVTLAPASESLWHCVAAALYHLTQDEYMTNDGMGTPWVRKQELATCARDYVEAQMRVLFKGKKHPLLRVLQQTTQKKHGLTALAVPLQLFYISIVFDVNVIVCDATHVNDDNDTLDEDEDGARHIPSFAYFPTGVWDETQAMRRTLLLLLHADAHFSICSVNHEYTYVEQASPERFVSFGTVNHMAREQVKKAAPNVASLHGTEDRATWCTLKGITLCDLERSEHKRSLMARHTKVEILALVNERKPTTSQEHVDGRKKLTKSDLIDLLLG